MIKTEAKPSGGARAAVCPRHVDRPNQNDLRLDPAPIADGPPLFWGHHCMRALRASLCRHTPRAEQPLSAAGRPAARPAAALRLRSTAARASSSAAGPAAAMTADVEKVRAAWGVSPFGARPARMCSAIPPLQGARRARGAYGACTTRMRTRPMYKMLRHERLRLASKRQVRAASQSRRRQLAAAAMAWAVLCYCAPAPAAAAAKRECSSGLSSAGLDEVSPWQRLRDAARAHRSAGRSPRCLAGGRSVDWP